jgi:UDP-2,3-diacylglucosamine hydrolase
VNLSKPRLGIVAGEGALPRTLSGKALEQGYETVAIGINLKSFVDLQCTYTKGKLIPICKAAQCLQYFKDNGVNQVVFIGKIYKLWAISQIPFLDNLARSYLKRISNLQDNTVHGIVRQLIEEAGFEVVSQVSFLKDLLAPKGHFTLRVLSEAEKADVEYGFEMAKRASELEVSQMVVVKNLAVMAFEAAEGTDQTIERGCKLAQKGGVVVKVAWKKQSDEFDLPTIGPRTIKTIAKNKGTVLAIQANSTFIAEPKKTIELANKLGVALLAI